MQYNKLADLGKYFERFFPSPGFFLEIGAWDGIHLSQSHYLETLGWRGVCVDPFPKNFEQRTAQLCKTPISADGCPREFIHVDIDRRHGGDVSYFSGFRDNLRIYWSLIYDHCDFNSVQLETMTMAQLYKTYSIPDHVEFLSVDTEGSEEEILLSIDYNRFSYGMIMFEHNEDVLCAKKIGDCLKFHGYCYLDTTGIDDIYVKKELL